MSGHGVGVERIIESCCQMLSADSSIVVLVVSTGHDFRATRRAKGGCGAWLEAWIVFI